MIFLNMSRSRKAPRKSQRGRPPLPAAERKRSLPIMFEPAQLAAIDELAITEGITKGEVVRTLVVEALAARRKKRRD